MDLTFTVYRDALFKVILLFAFGEVTANFVSHGNAICKIQNGSFQGSEVEVNTHEDVSFNCSVVPQGAHASTIRWTRGQRIYKKDVKSVPGLWSSLRIDSVGIKDDGKYICEVTTDTQRDLCTVTLHVNSPPLLSRDSGSFTTTPQVLPEGDSSVFHCYANGWPAPSFAWLKEGKKIKSGDAMNSLVLTTRLGGLDLEIFYVRQKEHAGRYTCVAYNKFGKKRHNILLSVLDTFPIVPPEVHTSVSQVTKHKNEDALLTCAGQNTPDTSSVISWIFNGTSLPLGTDDNVHHVIDYIYFVEGYIPKVNFSLLIRNVTERDTGSYTCEVLTLKGVDSDTIFLRLVKANEQHGTIRNNALLIPLLLASAGILCGLATAIIAHRVRRKRRRHVKGDLPLKDFQYDVFISFSSLDQHWVLDNLAPVLDRKRISYCIHSRDFVVGKAIIENIADSVYNSRKVLAVISKNYMDSRFCREELEMALYRCTEMADSSLILIRVDGVDHKRLPKTLRRRTFLDYSCATERIMWEERLLKQIANGKEGSRIEICVSSNSTDELINC
ncbi:uncharacterized protein [Montipora foliosa]|uniref:uncharacterized protein n=1 Tax=Montipora foliosa TaxID=591990 RepID=UPI0035F105DE